MAKSKKSHIWIFYLAMFLYAAAFLGAVACGLNYLWKYLDAYEQTRPSTALNAYWQKVDAKYICGLSQDLIDEVDHNIQSEEECREVILEALSGKLTYAKNVRESSDDRHVYVIQCDGRKIGTMEMDCRVPGEYGLLGWEVTKEVFDLSYLLTEPVSVTVPEFYTVYANGTALDESYLTEDQIKFTAFGDNYDRFTLPYQRTYTAGPCLGQLSLTVSDREGNPVEAKADDTTALKNCTPDEYAAVESICNQFVDAYVKFTSKAGGNVHGNYYAVRKFIVPNGDLDKRMNTIINGLLWSSEQHPDIQEISINYCWKLEDGRFLCDVTYVVDTWDYAGEMTTTRNDRIIFVSTPDGLRAEEMSNY